MTGSTGDCITHKLILPTNMARTHSTNLTCRYRVGKHPRLQSLNRMSGCCLSQSPGQLSSSSGEDQIITSIVMGPAVWLVRRGLTEVS